MTNNDNIIQYEKLEDYEKCDICRARKAKYVCDYINGVLFDAPNYKGVKVPIQTGQCSLLLCEKHNHKVNGRDYCPKHYEALKYEINQRKKECDNQ